MINKVILVGHLGADPELKHISADTVNIIGCIEGINATLELVDKLMKDKALTTPDFVGRSEQLPERLCKNNPNFKCNCIDQDRCPNFPPY